MTVRSTYLGLAATAVELAASTEVEQSWDQPSVLPGMSTAALTAHLLRSSLFSIEQYLDAPPPELTDDRPPVDAAHYYAAVPADVDDPVHRGVVERSQALAEQGHRASIDAARASLDRLRARVPAEPTDRSMAVLGEIPMLLDECLLARLVELVLHTEDLALSVGLRGPATDPEALAAVAHLSVDIARARHGDAAVVRAFYRRERQPVDILRAF